MHEIVSAREAVIRILKDHKACIAHELAGRAYQLYKLNFNQINKARDELFSESILNKEIISSPYGKPSHFYYLSRTHRDEVNRTIEYKLKLLRKHAERTEELGRFGEKLIGNIVESIGYEDIEIRKTEHNGIGISGMEIDVWCKHPDYDYYQNIEVKNRRQPVDSSDIIEVERKTSTAQTKWKLTVKPAIVCTFIYPKTLNMAKSKTIPTAITSKIYVPKKYENFYTKYKQAFGIYCIETTTIDNPPEYLTEIIEEYVAEYKY